MDRIAIIGNGAGGKSTLAHALSQAKNLPWHEVDKLQFGPNWTRIDEDTVRQQLNEITQEPKWVIDGFGPYDTILQRFELADQIIWFDHPFWVNCWWAAERQIAASHGKIRLGGPENCDLTHITKEMYQVLCYVHSEVRPKIIQDLQPHQAKTITINSPEALNDFHTQIGQGP